MATTGHPLFPFPPSHAAMVVPAISIQKSHRDADVHEKTLLPPPSTRVGAEAAHAVPSAWSLPSATSHISAADHFLPSHPTTHGLSLWEPGHAIVASSRPSASHRPGRGSQLCHHLPARSWNIFLHFHESCLICQIGLRLL